MKQPIHIVRRYKYTMKKGFFFVLIALFSVVLASCNTATTTYYFAATTPNESSSWVYYVIIEKQGDKIVDAEWNAYHIAGDQNGDYNGMDKYSASVEGLYDMNNGDGLWWHEQADLITDRLIETQDYNAVEPIPAGATITTTEFYSLTELALSNGPIEKGIYEDGYHFISLKDDAEQRPVAEYWDATAEEIITAPAFDYYTFGTFVVVNGRIVLAYFNSAYTGYRLQFDATGKIVKHTIDAEGDTPAKTLSVVASTTLVRTKNQLTFSYGMKAPNGPGQFEYHEASKTAGEYLIEHQTFPELNANNKFDAVAGVTITSSDFVGILELIPTK